MTLLALAGAAPPDVTQVKLNLERVADLATNIAADVVFLVEGKTIKHHAEAGREEPVGDDSGR